MRLSPREGTDRAARGTARDSRQGGDAQIRKTMSSACVRARTFRAVRQRGGSSVNDAAAVERRASADGARASGVALARGLVPVGRRVGTRATAPCSSPTTTGAPSSGTAFTAGGESSAGATGIVRSGAKRNATTATHSATTRAATNAGRRGALLCERRAIRCAHLTTCSTSARGRWTFGNARARWRELADAVSIDQRAALAARGEG